MMKQLSIAAAVAAIVLGTTREAQAIVLTFDDVSNTSGNYIYKGYGGFNWDNFYVVNRTVWPESGFDTGVVSGNYVAYNAWGSPALVSSSLFDFNGAYLTAAWNNGLSVVVEGLKNETSLYSKTVVVDTTSPTWFDFNFLGIDQLKFSSSGGVDAGWGWGKNFVMDNFTINETKSVFKPTSVASATSVPEPASTLGLMALGAVGAGSILKRKQQQKVAEKA